MKSVYIGVRLPADVVESITLLATVQYRSRSNMLEVLVREGLEGHKKELESIDKVAEVQ
jgi:metal-responsive CopG/Arc/MetJ family transcriptional regulator